MRALTGVRKMRLLWIVVLGAAASLPAPAAAQTPPTRGLETRTDVEYGLAAGQNLLMDAYIPPGPGPFPALVAIHGGGFVGGDKALMRGVSLYFARSGYAVFNINYRVAPAFPYPAAVLDAQTAVRFIREHAEDYKVDRLKIGAIGGSAGGTIAASLATATNGDLSSGSGIAAAVSWSGALDLAGVLEEKATNSRAADDILSYIGMPGADPSDPDVQKTLDAASPYSQLDAGDPPMFIANAEQELMPIEQAQAFVSRLMSLDIPHEFFTPPLGHALKYAAQAEPPTSSFLDTYLKGFSGGPSEAPSSLPPSVEPTPAPNGTGGIPIFPIVIIGGIVVVLGLALAPLISAVRRNREWRGKA